MSLSLCGNNIIYNHNNLEISPQYSVNFSRATTGTQYCLNENKIFHEDKL